MADLISLGMMAAPAISQMIQGSKQRKKARDLNVSTYIPPALRRKISDLTMMSKAGRYAGQDVDEANVRKNVADAMASVREGTSSSANILNAASLLNEQANQAFQNIGARAEQVRERRLADLNMARSEKSGVQMENQRRFQAAKGALEGAGSQNMFNALSNLAAIGVLARGGRGSGQENSAITPDELSGLGMRDLQKMPIFMNSTLENADSTLLSHIERLKELGIIND